MIGNDKANDFWAARMSVADELDCDASPEQRREFVTQKYREGRFRLPHLSFASQEELLKVWRVDSSVKMSPLNHCCLIVFSLLLFLCFV